MNFFEYNAVKVWFTDDDIVVQLKDGSTASLPLNHFPLLQKASLTERNEFQIIDGYALYWPLIGEDLSVEGFFVNKEKLITN